MTYETKPALSKTVAASATISAADSFVESPDMMNIYNGNIVTDSSGLGVVTLPDWFEALNRDFRYQLTVIGQFAQAVVAQEVANGRFVIRTDKPGVKVSAAASQAQHPDPAREVKIWSVTRAVQVAGCGTESWHP